MCDTADHPPPAVRPLPAWARVANLPFIGVIKLYQFTLSPIMGRQCRFSPTCSWYGLEAYRLHGPIRGTFLTAYRILRCNPFVRGGYDPVPLPKARERHAAPTPPTPPTPPAPPPPC